VKEFAIREPDAVDRRVVATEQLVEDQARKWAQGDAEQEQAYREFGRRLVILYRRMILGEAV
jgi:hypothetical protein